MASSAFSVDEEGQKKKKTEKNLGPVEPRGRIGHTAPLSDLLVNLWLNKSKRVFSSGGARTHTTRELKFSSLMLYQLSYRGF